MHKQPIKQIQNQLLGHYLTRLRFLSSFLSMERNLNSGVHSDWREGGPHTIVISVTLTRLNGHKRCYLCPENRVSMYYVQVCIFRICIVVLSYICIINLCDTVRKEGYSCKPGHDYNCILFLISHPTDRD